MIRQLKKKLTTALLLFLPACTPDPLPQDTLKGLYATPLAPPEKPLAVYYVGHSLVGRDIPAMVKQLAGAEHRYDVQLGWGTTLKAHWDPKKEPISGFERENNHPRYRDAHQAVDSGEYDALVLTEMVEIKASVKYYDSWDYLSRWAKAGWEKNPNLRVYLYETWHRIDDPEGWLKRLDRDLGMYWEGEILARAMAVEGMKHPIYVIPAGQVFARFVREVKSRGGVAEVKNKEALFALDAEGKQDPIHVSDLGAYLVALTHYSVLYHRSPIGLPYNLQHADGTPAIAPSEPVAKLMQEIVWDVVTGYSKTGIKYQ